MRSESTHTGVNARGSQRTRESMHAGVDVRESAHLNERGACLGQCRPKAPLQGKPNGREQAGHLLRPAPKATTVWAMSPTQDLAAREMGQSSYTITENHHA